MFTLSFENVARVTPQTRGKNVLINIQSRRGGTISKLDAVDLLTAPRITYAFVSLRKHDSNYDVRFYVCAGRGGIHGRKREYLPVDRNSRPGPNDIIYRNVCVFASYSPFSRIIYSWLINVRRIFNSRRPWSIYARLTAVESFAFFRRRPHFKFVFVVNTRLRDRDDAPEQLTRRRSFSTSSSRRSRDSSLYRFLNNFFFVPPPFGPPRDPNFGRRRIFRRRYPNSYSGPVNICVTLEKSALVYPFYAIKFVKFTRFVLTIRITRI